MHSLPVQNLEEIPINLLFATLMSEILYFQALAATRSSKPFRINTC